ncbi:methyltransferase domain-containing protein [Pseudomonadota bacterium]
MTRAPQLIDKEFVKGELIYSHNSAYHQIEISQQENIRLLHTDHQTIQSALNLDHPEQIPLPYMHAMMGGLLFQSPPKSCLLLGVGGGDLIRYLHHHIPACQITAVEHDPQMVYISREYFQCPTADNIDIRISDAEIFIEEKETSSAELLLIDLYGDKLPPLLDTPEFYSECHRVLSKTGILAMNLLTNDEREFKSILWQIRRRFKQQTLCLTVPLYNNIVVLAFKKRPHELNQAALSNRATSISSEFGINFSRLVENLFATNPLNGGELYF